MYKLFLIFVNIYCFDFVIYILIINFLEYLILLKWILKSRKPKNVFKIYLNTIICNIKNKIIIRVPNDYHF